MRRIAIINQKGGVGKTTTAVNLAAALAHAGQRVCVLDLDPQAHATTHLGIEPDGKTPSMYDVLINNRPLASTRQPTSQKLVCATCLISGSVSPVTRTNGACRYAACIASATCWTVTPGRTRP